VLRKCILVACLQAVVCLHAAVPAAVPQYGHRVWRIEDGLPQNRVRALSQTPDGYLWIGTSEGLVRFDGARFTVFDRSNTPALRDDGILALRLGADGTLWIGTEGGGLVSYNSGTFRNFGSRDGLTNGFVRAIFEDSRGTLWAGTDRGFFRREGARFVRLDNTPEVPNATVPSIAEDTAGKIWAVSRYGLLTIVNGRLVRKQGGCDTTLVHGLRPSRAGFLWSIDATGGGRVTNGCEARDPLLPAVPVHTIMEDHEGNLWIGTTGHGLFRLANGRLTAFAAVPDLAGNSVNAVFEDSEYNIWVGGEDGLLRLSPSSVTNVGMSEGLQDENVLTVYSSPPGNLWITTLTGQIYRIVGSGAKRYRLPEPAAKVPIRTVFQDRAGALWFGVFDGGIVRQTAAGATVYSQKNGLRNNATVRQMLEDGAGNLWFALNSGVSRWDGRWFRNYYLDDGLSYPSTRCLILDKRGDILVGTDAGLDRIHNGEIVRGSEFAALAGDKIWSIYQDSAGTLWLGTRGDGLLRYRSGAITRFTRNNGLTSNTIFQILEDRGGNLWMSTSSGVMSAARKELDAAAGDSTQQIHITPYGTADGMISSQMNGGYQPAGAMTPSGDLWFPGVKGVVRINPARNPRRHMLPVLMEKIVADSQPIPISSHVSIPPGHGRIEIDFTLCDLVSPQRVSFRYKLENFDENWTPALRTRSANYTNLPPGDYRFHVIAADPGSASGVSEAELSFRLLPAFYQTRWFYALLFLAAGASVWGGFAFYARMTRLRYALLLNERTRLAREMHDTVIQGCVGTVTLLEAAAGYRLVNPAEADKLVDDARIQVKNTLEEARDAVWNLRHPPPAESAVAMLFELARKLGREHGIEIETQIVGLDMSQDGKKASLDPDLDRTILLVGREALSNAVAHARPARIDIRLKYNPSAITLEVTDNGAGFSPEETNSAESRHFGLIGMRERVEAAGGSFRIRSSRGEGTSVTATLPIPARPIALQSPAEAQ